ncbi:MAG TPA: hypothetical protein VNU93_06855 [Verrucomicrobiae bacterium]|nr:hypothetical protein [Verrucomicrobiae bacterium]
MLDRKTRFKLLSLPNVVGFGAGFKEKGGAITQESAIVVLVSQKLPESQLAVTDMVPKKIQGTQTDVIEVGILTAHEAVNLNDFDSRTARYRPASPGVSLGHYKVTAGTFGAVVYDRSSGKPLILSNNHVLANSSNGWDRRASINDAILQPGVVDGGLERDNIIARLNRFVPLQDRAINYVDCAAALPVSDNMINAEILGIGSVKGTTPPALGMKLVKSGRTTGLTEGVIRAVNVTANVSYGNNRVLGFTDQILTTSMSAPGDSGSIVLNMNNQAVGLLFAGSDTSTLLNPIDNVLNLLKVTL